MAMKEIPVAKAKDIATKKGLKPGRVAKTDGIQFTKGGNPRIQTIDWVAFEDLLKKRKLAIYESNGWMKIMSKQ